MRSYLKNVVIDCRPEPRRFGDVIEPWQQQRSDAILPAIEHVAGFRDSYDGPLNFWFGYVKGADKSSFIARLFNGLLAYSKRRLRMYACAADADQAKLIRDAMDVESSLNPWLRRRLRILNKIAYSFTGAGSLEILASDAASGQGKLPDVVVMDELTHWTNKDFFDAIYSARNKRPNCVCVVLTNAGVKGTWQWELRNLAAASPNWHFFEQPPNTHLASWMNAARIAEDAKMLTPSEAKRLLQNVWCDPGETNGFVLYDEALACVDPSFCGGGRGSPHAARYLGVDYGPKRDRTALAVLHWDAAAKRVVVDELLCWAGSPQQPVPISMVEQWVDRVRKRYVVAALVVDPYQMMRSSEAWQKECGLRVVEFEARGGKSNYEMAANLRSLVMERKIAWGAADGLPGPPSVSPAPTDLSTTDTFTSELANLVLRPMAYGYRFDHESGRHDDRAVAVGMAALLAVREQRDRVEPPKAIVQKPKPLTDLSYAKSRNIFGVG